MNIYPDFLSDKTRQLLLELASDKEIQQYILVGGTALALQIRHRLSDDLDFIYDGECLPVNEIRRLIQHRFAGRFRIIKEDKNYQIDFVIDGVKVTFFSTGAVIIPFKVGDYTHTFQFLRIASPEIVVAHLTFENKMEMKLSESI